MYYCTRNLNMFFDQHMFSSKITPNIKCRPKLIYNFFLPNKWCFLNFCSGKLSFVKYHECTINVCWCNVLLIPKQIFSFLLVLTMIIYINMYLDCVPKHKFIVKIMSNKIFSWIHQHPHYSQKKTKKLQIKK
jgi:hypothetical protein